MKLNAKIVFKLRTLKLNNKYEMLLKSKGVILHYV